MNTARTILLSSTAAALTALLSACSSYSPEPPAPVVSSTIVTSEATYGVVESIQLVQVVPPPMASSNVSGEPIASTRSTYQIGVRLNHGGYQVFTQEDGAYLHVGQQVRIEHGMVRQV
jgi:hypothetical protein